MNRHTLWYIITVVIQKVLGIFSWKQTSVRSAATVLMVMVALSRVLGLFRDRLLAARFSPEELGVYFAAFRIPNLIFELLVMGALTAAFIPVFTRFASEEKKEEGWRLSSTLIHACSILFGVISVPMLLFTDQMSRALAPGFSPDQIQLMSMFTRIMIVGQVFPLLIGNFFTGILQSFHLFFAPAAAPVVYNIGIIGAIIFLSSGFGLYAPVIGIVIGAFLFIAIQIPSLIVIGYRHRLELNMHHAGVKEVVTLMVPRMIGLAISQIDTTVDLILSTLLGARMVTIFYFAQHLYQFPIGLFGVTVAQAAFPMMSQAAAKNDDKAMEKTIGSAINQALFFIFPITALFLVLRIPIVRLVFGASRYDWEATVLTGLTLSAFAISLFTQAISQIVTRAFYALLDSKTPVIIGVVSIILNASLSAIFILYFHFSVWSLAISTSIASIVNTVILVIVLVRKMGTLSWKTLISSPLRMAVAAGIMVGILFVPLKLLDQLIFDTSRISGLILLTGITSFIGLAWYWFLVWVFGVTEARVFFRLLEKFRKGKPLPLEPAAEIVSNGAQDAPVS